MDFKDDEKFDNILLDIIQQVNTLPNFLDVLFGFLRRRTDLYYTMVNSQSKMGFFPGKAEKLILDAFKKHKNVFESCLPNNSVLNETQKSHPNPSEKYDRNENPIKNIPMNDNSKISEPENNDLIYVADAESYNGSIGDNYTWSQSIGELDIRVKIPENSTNSKDLKVSVEKKHITVQANIQNELQSIIDKDLCWEVKKNEVFWSFDRKESKIFISLEKVQERWWEALFVGESAINTRKIDCSRPMSDLDDEAQAKIHKLMYDNHQKQLGLPTSDQQEMNNALKKAWNLEGSPFKGKEFDLSNIDIVDKGN